MTLDFYYYFAMKLNFNHKNNCQNERASARQESGKTRTTHQQRTTHNAIGWAQQRTAHSTTTNTPMSTLPPITKCREWASPIHKQHQPSKSTPILASQPFPKKAAQFHPSPYHASNASSFIWRPNHIHDQSHVLCGTKMWSCGTSRRQSVSLGGLSPWWDEQEDAWLGWMFTGVLEQRRVVTEWRELFFSIVLVGWWPMTVHLGLIKKEICICS